MFPNGDGDEITLANPSKVGAAWQGAAAATSTPQPSPTPSSASVHSQSSRPPTYVAVFDVDANLVKDYTQLDESLMAFCFSLPGAENAFLLTSYDAGSIVSANTLFAAYQGQGENLNIRCVLTEKLRQYGFNIQGVVTSHDGVFEKHLVGEINLRAAITEFNQTLQAYQLPIPVPGAEENVAKSELEIQAEAAAKAAAKQELLESLQNMGYVRAELDRMLPLDVNLFDTIVQQITVPGTANRYQLGSYYQQVILPLEQQSLGDFNAYRAALAQPTSPQANRIALEAFFNNFLDTHQNAGLRQIVSGDCGARNKKYWGFLQIVKSYSATQNLAEAVGIIKAQNIHFIFSDDSEKYCEAVSLAAQDMNLIEYVHTIHTDLDGTLSHFELAQRLTPKIYFPRMPDGAPSAVEELLFGAKYVANFKSKFISNKIIEQRQIAGQYLNQNRALLRARRDKLLRDNLLTAANNFDYRAFKRLAVKCVKRQTRRGGDSTTLQEELGNKICLTWALKFLKLAWLFRRSAADNLELVHDGMIHQIRFTKRLFEIYKVQNQLKTGGLSPDLYWDANLQGLEQKFEVANSPWKPFLDLADNIDNMIAGDDYLAWFRLGLYYAILDAANPDYDPAEILGVMSRQGSAGSLVPFEPGAQSEETATNHYRKIKNCFEKADHLFGRLPQYQQLRADILDRKEPYEPNGCQWLGSWRSVVLYNCAPRPGDTRGAIQEAMEATPARGSNRLGARGNFRTPETPERRIWQTPWSKRQRKPMLGLPPAQGGQIETAENMFPQGFSFSPGPADSSRMRPPSPGPGQEGTALQPMTAGLGAAYSVQVEESGGAAAGASPSLGGRERTPTMELGADILTPQLRRRNEAQGQMYSTLAFAGLNDSAKEYQPLPPGSANADQVTWLTSRPLRPNFFADDEDEML